MVKFGYENIRDRYIYLSFLVVSTLVILLGTFRLLPSIFSYEPQYDKAICSEHLDSAAGFITLFVPFAAISISARVIQIGAVIACSRFMKKNAVGRSSKPKVAAMKFATIVTAINVVFTFDVIITLIIQFMVFVDLKSYLVLLQLLYFIPLNIHAMIVSLVMIAVFKPLRNSIKMILLPSKCKGVSLRNRICLTSAVSVNNGGTLGQANEVTQEFECYVNKT